MSESCCSVPETAEAGAGADGGLEPRGCPECGSTGPRVEQRTVAAMTRGSLAPKQSFRLCREGDCEVVYHGDRGARLEVADLHVVPGFKTPGADGLLCYCFLHTRAEIEQQLRASGETTVPERITEGIRTGSCACEVRNPTGRCCLGEVNSAIASIRERLPGS